jgi:hypothetical protein
MQVSSRVHTAIYLLEYVVIGVLAMHSLIHWFVAYENAVAVLVTVGVALLIVCCLGCSSCPSRDKDDVFNRHKL